MTMKNDKHDSKWLENDLSKSKTLTSVRCLDDYRRIPLYPTLEDVINSPPSLRANQVKQPYTNCDEYLDIFFRLMREDFVSVIRDTLKCLKRTNSYENLDTRTIWCYKNVEIVKSRSKVTMFFQFDTPNHAEVVDYENSKQFKNGSLLLLSKDQFTTFILGTVVETFRLNKGIVGVDVIDYKEVNKWSVIDLLEPAVFYEPYRYVMGVLQDMYETNFPMKNYIVYGSKDVSFPSYLAGNSIYNINGIEFDILKHDQWPSPKVLNMDINQYEAFKGALTKEFAMIQGPPGTGKTYIGLEIVKIIIENLYETKKLINPIMIVCMTNHALDQFLEGIWKITRNISRFGRGTKSDILVNYIPTMSVARKDSCADIYVDARRDVVASIKTENVHLTNIKEVDSNQGVLDLSCLEGVLAAKGFDTWFRDSYDLLSWLLCDIPTIGSIHPMDFMKQNKLLSSFSIKKKKATNKLFCITLKSIKLYCTKVQYQLNSLNEDTEQEDGDDVSKKHDLELALKIMKTVEDNITKHLKLYTSETFIDCNSKFNHELLVQRDRWLLYYSWVHLFLTHEKSIIESAKETTRQCRRNAKKFESIGYLKPVKNKYVIGMTTTAAARNRYLLKNLKCPIS